MNSSIAVSMVDDVFWKQCYDLTNEMRVHCYQLLVVPSFSYKISGLDPHENYSMSVHFEHSNDKKWRWVKNQYVPFGRPDNIKSVSQTVFHSKGQQKGRWWMEKNVDFSYLQLTSQEVKQGVSDRIQLQAGYKWIPVLTIFKNGKLFHEAQLEHTEFLAVNTVRNPKLIDLKNHIRKLRRGRRLYVPNFNLSRILPSSVHRIPLKVINKPKDFSIQNILCNK